MASKVQQCQTIIGYDFTDPNLCWEALQTAGNGIHAAGSRPTPNGSKRLAILGGSVLSLILSMDWYDSGAVEGKLNTNQAPIAGTF